MIGWLLFLFPIFLLAGLFLWAWWRRRKSRAYGEVPFGAGKYDGN